MRPLKLSTYRRRPNRMRRAIQCLMSNTKPTDPSCTSCEVSRECKALSPRLDRKTGVLCLSNALLFFKRTP
jgi:hypothetical protein